MEREWEEVWRARGAWWRQWRLREKGERIKRREQVSGGLLMEIVDKDALSGSRSCLAWILWGIGFLEEPVPIVGF